MLSVAMVTEDGISQGSSIDIQAEKISLSKLDPFVIARNNKASREGEAEEPDCLVWVWNNTSI